MFNRCIEMHNMWRSLSVAIVRSHRTCQICGPHPRDFLRSRCTSVSFHNSLAMFTFASSLLSTRTTSTWPSWLASVATLLGDCVYVFSVIRNKIWWSFFLIEFDLILLFCHCGNFTTLHHDFVDPFSDCTWWVLDDNTSRSSDNSVKGCICLQLPSDV